MPLLLAFPVGLVLGGSLAWLARSELSRTELPLLLARPFLVALGLGAVVYAPVVAYFVALHGDWAYAYLIDSTRVPSALDLTLVALASAQVPLGFALGAPWALAKRGAAFSRAGAALGALVLVACLVGRQRLAVSASYAQFSGGFGLVPIGKSSLGRGVLLAWIALLAGYGWSVRVLRSPRPD